MSKRTPTFNVGDKVAYSVQWLKSVGMSHSDYARARGEVTDVRALGGSPLITVEWSDPDIPARILAANLAHVGPNTRFANC